MTDQGNVDNYATLDHILGCLPLIQQFSTNVFIGGGSCGGWEDKLLVFRPDDIFCQETGKD